MPAASTNGDGECVAFPDTCKVPPAPPVPTPFPNQAALSDADGGTCSGRVLILNKKTVVKKTVIRTSSGDEAGSAGGVVSSKTKGEARFKKASSKVKAEGQEVVYVGCTTGQNGSNANAPGGSQVKPSQDKVDVAP